MPYEQMDQQQVAAYLRMDVREVNKLSCRGQIPCRKAGGQFVYFKGDIDHWVESQMPGMGRRRLADIEKGVSEHHGLETESLRVWPLIPPGGIAVPLESKTRDAVLRDLIALAQKGELVFDRDDLLEAVRHREELCSTALVPGVAFPHPRHPRPHDIAASFIVAGLTSSGIPFGAQDGSLTRLFFLICCKDEQTHLHVLARLARMLHNQEAVDRLFLADNPQEFGDVLQELERSVLAEE